MPLIMKRYIPALHLLSAIILLLVFITGCTKEQIQETENDNILAFRINTRALIGEELEGVTIRSIRVLIANKNLANSTIVINRLIDNQNGTPEDFVFKLQKGQYQICVVANETDAMRPLLAATGKLSDLNAITVVPPANESGLVLYQSIHVTLRPQASAPEQGEVSVDGGNTWVSPPSVLIALERVASKISLSIRKQTINAADRFDIKKVELVNLASNSYLIPGRVHTGGLSSAIPFDAPSLVSFVTNNEVKPIFNNYIVPEYPLAAPASPDNAAALIITAAYTKSGGAPRDVIYTVPVLGKGALDYSLKRNCHYNIVASITQTAESMFTLNIEYEVVKWTNAGNGNFEAGAVTFSSKWEDGTDITDNLIAVANNTSVTYEFTLSFPPEAVWTAQLTNTQDFDFDVSNNGVREGITAPGVVYKIKVRPRAAVSANDVTTEFYITVFNGIENVELNLTGNGTGEGNRFIIKQNPN